MNPSETIDSRYRLERLLGTGGMSEVWLAEDLRLSRWVAVKLLREVVGGDQDGELVAAFDREARLIARLQHPNIVAVYDSGTWNGRHYFVMEYVHGYSMRRLLEARGRLTEGEAIAYASLVADALEYAHQQGIVHCDVKPENVLVTEQGVAKVVDFGVADTLTRTLLPDQARDILGTIAYLAPEVIQGAPADARSDVYSLALTVYEMVAGRLPFAGGTAAAMAGQRLGTPAPPVRRFNAEVSPALEQVLVQALSLNQADRFQTAAEFAGALRWAARQIAPTVAAATTRVRPNLPGDTPLRQRHATERVVARKGPPPSRPREPSGGGSGGAVLAVILVVLLAVAAGVLAAFLLTRNSGGGPASTPTPTAQPSPSATATPTNQPTSTPTATASPTATPSPTPTSSPTSVPATPTATSGLPRPTVTLPAGPTGTPAVPTPTP